MEMKIKNKKTIDATEKSSKRMLRTTLNTSEL